MIEYAKKYAARGWYVLPLNGKVPYNERGLSDASIEMHTIERWWKAWPKANIGIRTGAISGFVVLDIDILHDGEESLHELERRFGKLPPTVTVITGRGGSHYYFQHPGQEVRNAAGVCGFSGVDFRGDGGYVVAPPSVTERKYEWEVGGARTLAALPAWLIERREEHKAVAEDAVFPEGQRNDSLVRLAGAMRRYGAGIDAIRDALLDTNSLRCRPPLREFEVEAIVKSVMRYPYEVESSHGPGRGASSPSRNSGDQRRGPDASRISESRLFRRAR